MPGPPKKPSALKLIEGTFRKDRAVNEARPEAAIPPCPSHLDKEAKAEWRRISKEIVRVNLLSRQDRAALAAYCQSWSRWTAVEIQLQSEGLTVLSANGQPYENPLYSISKRERELMHKFLIEFGLTPASRARIDVGPVEKADPLTEFLRRKNKA